jgi:hypothetical protein
VHELSPGKSDYTVGGNFSKVKRTWQDRTADLRGFFKGETFHARSALTRWDRTARVARKELAMNTRDRLMTRRGFLKGSCLTAFGIAALPANMPAIAAFAPDDPKATHNMMVVGEKTIFLSHLPMFGSSNPRKKDFSPHRFQANLEAVFTKGGEDLGEIYATDRRQHPDVRMYTLRPEPFVLRHLAPVDTRSTARTSFTATVFRDHLERVDPPLVIKGMEDINVTIKKVIHLHEFDSSAKKPTQLEYLLFGKGDELFLAHFVTRPPDFDQIVSVKVPDHVFTDDELGRGVRVNIPGREDTPPNRIKEKQEARGELSAASGAAAQSLTLQVGTEFYFEEGELRMPPSFGDTREEIQAGFGQK